MFFYENTIYKLRFTIVKVKYPSGSHKLCVCCEKEP